jgi:glyceraldehyde 3-phosphate dehydrogenase
MLLLGLTGFGRIGRQVLRHILDRDDVDVVAVNDPFLDAEYMAYLMRYDTVHGRLPASIRGRDNMLEIGDKKVKVYAQK